MKGEFATVFNNAMRRIRHRTHQSQLLYQSSLITLVSASEWFLAQLLHEHFAAHPDVMGAKDKLFSLDDLRGLGSIEDAQRHLIDINVEEILRGSLADWLDFLKTRLKLSMGYIEPFLGRLTEITQRRNLLVHNGGMVNSIYMAKVGEEFRREAVLGQEQKFGREYLEGAIRIFERVFLLIGAELWKKVAPKDEKRSDVLFEIAWKHLVAERWDIAEGLSYFVMNDKQLSEIARLVGTCNYWQSLKWQDRLSEVRGDIEQADFSAKKLRFSIGQAALLDDDEKFFSLVDEAVRVGEISEKDLKEWPIFRKIRETQRFKDRFQEQPSNSEIAEPAKDRGEIIDRLQADADNVPPK